MCSPIWFSFARNTHLQFDFKWFCFLFKLMYLKIISFGGNTNLGKGWWYLCCNGYPLRFQQYVSLTEINRKFFISGIAIRPKRIRVYNCYYLTSSADLSFSSHLALEYILLTIVILCNARSSVWRSCEKRLFRHWYFSHAYNLSLRG